MGNTAAKMALMKAHGRKRGEINEKNSKMVQSLFLSPRRLQ